MKDKHIRSVIKTFSWRIIATLTTMALVFTFTGLWELTLGVGILDVILKLFFYYGHERIWNRINWGKK